MKGFIKRNLLMFFRDKASVFFSLLAVFIIIALYALFLGDVWTSSLNTLPNADVIMKLWIMAGLTAVTSATTTMGAFGTMVEDKARGTYKDFSAAPISRMSISGGYVISSYIIGVIMTIVAFVLALIYLVVSGAPLPAAITFLKIFGLILLSTLTNTALIFLVVSFFKSINAYSTASTVVGTLIGFITGIYLPIGNLPEAVQTVVKLFPVSHAASLMREVMMRDMLNESFAGAPAEYMTDFCESMGVTYRFGDTVVTPLASVIVLVGSAILFFAIATFMMSRKKK